MDCRYRSNDHDQISFEDIKTGNLNIKIKFVSFIVHEKRNIYSLYFEHFVNGILIGLAQQNTTKFHDFLSYRINTVL